MAKKLKLTVAPKRWNSLLPKLTKNKLTATKLPKELSKVQPVRKIYLPKVRLTAPVKRK